MTDFSSHYKKAIWPLITVVAIVATWFAARALTPPRATAPDVEIDYYTVESGEIYWAAPLNANVTWTTSMTGFAATAGTITSLNITDDQIKAGDKIYTINLEPSFAIVGATPAFRDLTQGDQGPDVAQLQTFLGLKPSGRFDATTRAGVEKWQRSAGITPDGVVHLGQLLVFPSLPIPAKYADGIEVGSVVSQGQAIVHTFSASPMITVTASDNPELPIKAGMSASIVAGDKEYPGVLKPWDSPDAAEPQLAVTLEDGTSACTRDCATQIPHNNQAKITVKVNVIPPTQGLVAPISAIRTDASGSNVVTLKDGTLAPVDVVVAHGGRAVITGIDAGASIKLFGDKP